MRAARLPPPSCHNKTKQNNTGFKGVIIIFLYFGGHTPPTTERGPPFSSPSERRARGSTVHTMFLNEDAFNLSDDEGAGGEDMRYAARLGREREGNSSLYFQWGQGWAISHLHMCQSACQRHFGTFFPPMSCHQRLVKPDQESTPTRLAYPPLPHTHPPSPPRV